MIPLSAYAGMARWVGLAIVVLSLMGLGGYMGWKWQAGNVEEAEQARDKAALERDRANQRAQGYQSAIDQQKAASEAAQAAAAAQQRRADAAVAAAKAERDRYERELARITAGIEKDKLDPKCKAQLEAPVCGAAWE